MPFTKNEELDAYEEVQQFPYISSRLPEGAVVRTSELRLSGAELSCLLLFLLLFLYSAFIFFRVWKKNYRMPEGVFYFEEKSIESKPIIPRIETKISMNFVPWESFDISSPKDGNCSTATGSFKLKRAKSDAAHKSKRNRIILLKKSRSYSQRFVDEII